VRNESLSSVKDFHSSLQTSFSMVDRLDLISIPDRDNSGRTPKKPGFLPFLRFVTKYSRKNPVSGSGRTPTKKPGFLPFLRFVTKYSRKNPVSDHGCASPILCLLFQSLIGI
jgi:hypothetical protein